MAIDAEKALPYGLRDVKITPISAAGVYGTMIDLPVSRTMTWTDTVDTQELRGDDKVVATRESSGSVDWDLEAGGIPLTAYAAIAGGVVALTGVTPAAKRTYSKVGSDNRPYFYCEGQAINDNGGDTHVVLYRCKATGDIGGEFSDGAFALTNCSGSAVPDSFHSDKVYDIVHNETTLATVVPT